MFEIRCGEWKLCVCLGELPELYAIHWKNARLAEEFDLTGSEGKLCFFSIGSARRPGPPLVSIAQRYEPYSPGFNPGALVTDDGTTLFLGAGTRLLAYDLRKPERLWQDTAAFGFWGWEQHGDCVLMAAELEFSAYTSQGTKLWSAGVEPPWGYSVSEGLVHLDVMGKATSFPLTSGPPE